MTPERDTMHAALNSIFKAISALFLRDDTREAQAALGRCVEHLSYRDASCVADVLQELETADAALLGKENVYEPRQAIVMAAMRLRSLQNEKPLLEQGLIA
jgi:hypothetical protein